MPWIGLLLGALIGACLKGFRGFAAAFQSSAASRAGKTTPAAPRST